MKAYGGVPYRNSNSDPSVVQPLASRCINYAIPAIKRTDAWSN
jgi:hypothetical protein